MASARNIDQEKKLSPSSSGPTRRPTSAEVLTTYQKLFNQTKTPRVSGWSGKTREKALGWANLAERARKWPDDQKPRLALLTSLVENPFTSETLRSQCEKELTEIPEGAELLKETLKRKNAALRTCLSELPKRVRQSGLTEDEIIKRVATREVARKCRGDLAFQLQLLETATKGHAFSLELIVRIVANNESDAWIFENVRPLVSKIRENVDPELLQRACQTNVRFAELVKDSGANSERRSNIQ